LEYELRRGSQSATIYDICFNQDSTLLVAYSSNGTVHIFELYSDINNTKNTRSILSGFKDYLPKWVDSQWGFKQINTNNTTKAVCVFDENNDVHIATYDGSYYRINGRNKEFVTITQGSLHINNK
jgi:WD40 repeat protein